MAPLLESKLTTIPSCKTKQNVNYQGGDVYCKSELETWSTNQISKGTHVMVSSAEKRTQAKKKVVWLLIGYKIRYACSDWLEQAALVLKPQNGK